MGKALRRFIGDRTHCAWKSGRLPAQQSPGLSFSGGEPFGTVILCPKLKMDVFYLCSDNTITYCTFLDTSVTFLCRIRIYYRTLKGKISARK